MAGKPKAKPKKVPETGPAGDAAREDILDAFAGYLRRPGFLAWVHEGREWWESEVRTRAKVRAVHMASNKLRKRWWEETGEYVGGPQQRPKPNERLMATPEMRSWESLIPEEQTWIAALRLSAFLFTHRPPEGEAALPAAAGPSMLLRMEVVNLSNRDADTYLKLVAKAVAAGATRPLSVTVGPDDPDEVGPQVGEELWPPEVTAMVKVYSRLLTRWPLVLRKWSEYGTRVQRLTRREEPEGWRTALPPDVMTFRQLADHMSARRHRGPAGARDWHGVWDALDGVELAIRQWRQELNFARKGLPTVAPWMDNQSLPPVQRWTALALATLNRSGGLLPELGTHPLSDVDLSAFRAGMEPLIQDLALLKSVPNTAPGAANRKTELTAPESIRPATQQAPTPMEMPRTSGQAPLLRLGKRRQWEFEAALLLLDNPEREHQEIARAVGKHPGTLSKSEFFQSAVRMSKQGGTRLLGFIEAETSNVDGIVSAGNRDGTQQGTPDDEDPDDRLNREFDELERKRNPKRK